MVKKLDAIFGGIVVGGILLGGLALYNRLKGFKLTEQIAEQLQLPTPPEYDVAQHNIETSEVENISSEIAAEISNLQNTYAEQYAKYEEELSQMREIENAIEEKGELLIVATEDYQAKYVFVSEKEERISVLRNAIAYELEVAANPAVAALQIVLNVISLNAFQTAQELIAAYEKEILKIEEEIKTYTAEELAPRLANITQLNNEISALSSNLASYKISIDVTLSLMQDLQSQITALEGRLTQLEETGGT